MNPTDNLIDFASYRKRKQAQQRARAMWDMYTLQAGLPTVSTNRPTASTEPRHA